MEPSQQSQQLMEALYTEVAQEYANKHIRLNRRLLKKELSERGTPLGISSVHRHLKALKATIKNLRIKPKLTALQKEARLRFVLQQMDRSHGLDRATHRYKDQLDTVHVDESWFYLNRVTNQVLIFDGVDVPECPSTWHKSHIVKVMFLVAMARPQPRPDGTQFDGKIGLWPCIIRSPAKRNSKNRVAGTVETKPVNVTAAFYRQLFLQPGGVIEKIKQKMPWMRDSRVYVQQDGARPHTGGGNIPYINAQAGVGGWRIRLKTQTAQSPDFNILDLGLFHSLKTRVTQIKFQANSVDDLILKVKQAYNEYDADTLDHIWGHLYQVYNEVLKCDGANNYKPPHKRARAAHKVGPTSVNLTINLEHYNRVANALA